MKRVLMVEDEAPVRRLLRRWAESEGAEVLEAETAEEGLATACRLQPAVAFCDVNLPGKNGVWLADRLRVEQPDAAVILATGLVDSKVAITGVQAGAVDYVVKPFDRARILEALRRGLTTNASRRALSEIKATRAELETSAEISMGAVLALMQAEDPRAEAQARRVARLAINLALMLDVREPEITDIERAALLNDVSRLSVGSSPVLQVPVFSVPLDIAAAARRRGLSGDRPLGARIVSVARAYDDLVARDPGDEMTPPAALARLTAGGAEFDGAVVQALLALQPGLAAA